MADSSAGRVDRRGRARLFTMRDRYPLTVSGNLGFLEQVRDEVRRAANWKRDDAFPDATLRQTIDGIDVLRPEALRRTSKLTVLREAAKHVSETLAREMTIGTIERIDELLWPAVTDLREASEQQKLSPSPVEPVAPRVVLPRPAPAPQPSASRAKTTSKARGRKLADPETLRHEAELVANWERARQTGAYKPEFAVENGMNAKEFQSLLNRVAKRTSRKK